MKRKFIILLLISILAMTGCSEVQMSPRYQNTLELSVINLNNILEDCKNGNNNSCVKGFEKAVVLLDHMLDASYGKRGE